MESSLEPPIRILIRLLPLNLYGLAILSARDRITLMVGWMRLELVTVLPDGRLILPLFLPNIMESLLPQRLLLNQPLPPVRLRQLVLLQRPDQRLLHPRLLLLQLLLPLPRGSSVIYSTVQKSP